MTEKGFVELTYAGGLELEKITVRTDAVTCVQKPKSGKFGCIVVVDSEKYPVAEGYGTVLKMLGAKEL